MALSSVSCTHAQVVTTKLVRWERERCSFEPKPVAGTWEHSVEERGLTILICIAISICSWELWDQQLWGLARAGFSSQKWFVVDGMMACQAGRAYLCCNPQSHSNLSQSEIQVNRHFIIRGWKVSSVLISKMMKIEAMNTAVRLSDWADETQVSIN